MDGCESVWACGAVWATAAPRRPGPPARRGWVLNPAKPRDMLTSSASPPQLPPPPPTHPHPPFQILNHGPLNPHQQRVATGRGDDATDAANVLQRELEDDEAHRLLAGGVEVRQVLLRVWRGVSGCGRVRAGVGRRPGSSAACPWRSSLALADGPVRTCVQPHTAHAWITSACCTSPPQRTCPDPIGACAPARAAGAHLDLGSSAAH